MNPFRKILSRLQDGEEETVFDELIRYSKKEISPNEIAELARVLAASGTLLQISNSNEIADIPSTGGPSSLSTMLTPLFLKQFGCVVPKLGVPGRPAGGVDVLAQIEGYNISPEQEQLKKWIENSYYVHFVGGGIYAPMDRKLFEFRKKTDNVNVPSLVVASILSKKIAAGLKRTGLDVRISSFGNFGKNWMEARSNAKLFKQVASLVGINADCFLTNAQNPLQPYIGRGEALLAINQILDDKASPWLMQHVYECYSMAKIVAGTNGNGSYDFDLGRLRSSFNENVELQGGTIESFRTQTETILSAHQHCIIAEMNGFVSIDLQRIRSVIVEFQSGETGSGGFPDPCGVILKARQGDFVKRQTALCSYRCATQIQPAFHKKLKEAVSITKYRWIPYNFEQV